MASNPNQPKPNDTNGNDTAHRATNNAEIIGSGNDINGGAVQLSDISLSFRAAAGGSAVHVLKNINLRADSGEKIALTGPSGAGKTSLLAMVAGLLRPTSGQVCTLGHPLSSMSEDELAAMRRDYIGIVFQHFHLLETMTAQENTALPLQLTGCTDANTLAAESLRAVGLESRLQHFPSQLSGGERQRVAIARAFVSRPKLLLADEPTGNLDYDSGNVVLRLLMDMAREQNATLLFVTHNRDILKQFDTVRDLQYGGLV